MADGTHMRESGPWFEGVWGGLSSSFNRGQSPTFSKDQNQAILSLGVGDSVGEESGLRAYRAKLIR